MSLHENESAAENDAGTCHVRHASDGTTVRVHGDIDQAALDSLTASVKAMVERECGAVSDIPMPAIAQRIHGRETYACRLDRDHEGCHGWPTPPASTEGGDR